MYPVSRFKVGQLQATNIANIFLGSTNLAPLLGAFVSDAYLGRFRTLAYGSFATLLVRTTHSLVYLLRSLYISTANVMHACRACWV